jgi:hypothetical protein
MSPFRVRTMRLDLASAPARWLCAAAMLLPAAACFDAGVPMAPDSAPLTVVSRIDCVGSTVARSVSCTPAASASVMQEDRQSGSRLPVPKAMHDLILGNQGGYVKLESSNIVVAGGVFAFDVTLKNLIPQSIGTSNGFSAAAGGSKVFFSAGPQLTSGSGTIDFVNPGGGFFYDGTATFTSANQPYFKYVAILNTGDVSAAKTWQLRFDPGVLTFSFSVFVSTPVKFQDGYVDGNPNVLTLNFGEASSSLGGTVRSAVGNPIGGTVDYLSSNPAVATVSSSGVVTAGSANGVTYVSLSSGALPGYLSTAVNVCASTPTLTSGVPVVGAIDATDCYSSFANSGRPDPSFQSDMYRVSLTAGQQVGITMTSDGTFAPCIALADPSGVQVSFACTTGNTATIPAGAAMPASGIYTIEAGQADPFTPGSTFGYTLGVTVTP